MIVTSSYYYVSILADSREQLRLVTTLLLLYKNLCPPSEMEKVYIPDADAMSRLIDELDGYLSYCDILSQYMDNLTKDDPRSTLVINKMPVPLHVLRELSYKQNTIVNFGSTEMKKLTSLVADVACLYGMWPRSDVVKPMSPPSPVKSFNKEKRQALQISTDELLKAIDRHRNNTVELRQQQKKCWDLSAKLSEKRSRMEAFKKKYDRKRDLSNHSNTSRKLRAKLQKLSDAIRDVQDDVTTNQITFCEMVELENEVKDEMFQIRDRIHQHIQGVVARRMADCVWNVHAFLQTAHRSKEAHVLDNRHLPVIQTMCRMRTGAVVDELIQQASGTYSFPDTKEYPVYMKETPRLPVATLDKQIGSCMKKHSKTVVGSLCLSKNLNGYHLKISGQPGASLANPGYFPVNKNLHVKCKLGMLHGDVGFGWTRKSRYNPTKTWGFFIRPPSLTDITERSQSRAANPAGSEVSDISEKTRDANSSL
ncbi:uncharacterized protein [Argopecten irradians]|uniref:uncharacterized protein n=1 Tax=Argopecten irradians TaxID=31199 RepID=UPI0037240C62